MTTYTGQVVNGAVVFDGPPPPDGTRVRLELLTNGVPTPSANGVHPPAPPADDSDIDPDGVMTPRMIELIRESQAAEPDGETLWDRCPSLHHPCLDLPADASQNIDAYLRGERKP